MTGKTITNARAINSGNPISTNRKRTHAIALDKGADHPIVHDLAISASRYRVSPIS